MPLCPRHRILAAALMAIAVFNGPASAQTAIVIDAGRETGRLNPWAFGQNIEAADDRGLFGAPADAKEWSKFGVKYGQGLWNPETGQPAAEASALLRRLNIGMLRYPGGCLVHNFNWKQAVGPLDGRPDWKFGIDQYLELCRRFGLEPLITLTDYALPADELPGHLAELVEYLNAPAVAANPWAMKRAAWGHPEPYGVKYFELGNESGHGNHDCVPKRRYSAGEYAAYAAAVADAVRKVDPTVKLGLVTDHGDAMNLDSPWNRIVLAGAGKAADYVVVHFYGPGLRNTGARKALVGAMAFPEQLDRHLAAYRAMIREHAGRDLPLAVTEYNVGSSANQPFPHRHSFLAGLMVADCLRLWQTTDTPVLFANYWQLLNPHWGLFDTRPDAADGTVVRRYAPLPFFEAWADFKAERLVAVDIRDNPRVAAPAMLGLLESRGETPEAAAEFARHDTFAFDFHPFNARPDLAPAAKGTNALAITATRTDKDAYPPFFAAPRPERVQPGRGYTVKLTGEARVTATAGKAVVAFGMSDVRGWAATQSATMSAPIPQDGAFHPVAMTLAALPDGPGTDVLLRVERIGAPFSGTVELRNLVLTQGTAATVPAYPALTALAGKSADGRRLHLAVFNKDPDRDVEAPVTLRGAKAGRGTALELFRETPEATDAFEPARREAEWTGERFAWRFPRHSATFFTFDLR